LRGMRAILLGARSAQQGPEAGARARPVQIARAGHTQAASADPARLLIRAAGMGRAASGIVALSASKEHESEDPREGARTFSPREGDRASFGPVPIILRGQQRQQLRPQTKVATRAQPSATRGAHSEGQIPGSQATASQRPETRWEAREQGRAGSTISTATGATVQERPTPGVRHPSDQGPDGRGSNPASTRELRRMPSSSEGEQATGSDSASKRPRQNAGEPSAARVQGVVQPSTPEIALAIEKIKKEHAMKRQKQPRFAREGEKQSYKLERELDALIELLPQQVVTHRLGGERAMAQVPDPERQEAMIRRCLKEHAGSDGAKAAALRGFLRVAREYAARVLHKPDRREADAALFPMSAALAHELINNESERALAAAKGSQEGKSVGARFRDTAIHASDKARWPIEVPRELLAAAAPKATAYARDKAGTPPLAAKCHIEEVAAGVSEGLPSLPEEARTIVIEFAQGLLAGNLDQSMRVGEGCSVEMLADNDEPALVMRGSGKAAKDGAPINMYAPAEGFTGRYVWFGEWLNKVVERGYIFPKFNKKRGSGGCILQNKGEIEGACADKSEVRDAFKALLTMEPLAYTAEEIAEMCLDGHSMHAGPPDWGRTIAQPPRLTCLPDVAELKVGFSPTDIQALGHWLRDKGSKAEANVERAAVEAIPQEARVAAARAAMPGAPATRNEMQSYYGDAGAGNARLSERMMQLRVRQRLTHTIRHVIAAAGGWRAMHVSHRGQADLHLLSPSE